MAKHQNAVFKVGYEAARDLSNVDLPFDISLAVFDALETLGPRYRGIDAQRMKLVHKHGLDKVSPDTVTTAPGFKAFMKEFEELLVIEQEAPKNIAPVQVKPSVFKAAGVSLSGQKLNALRKLGVLVLLPEEDTTQEPETKPDISPADTKKRPSAAGRRKQSTK